MITTKVDIKDLSVQDLEILKENEEKRVKPLVYTRTMGYYRPVESFNIGKKGEFKERKWFEEKHVNLN